MRVQGAAPVGGSTGGRYRQGTTGQTRRGSRSVVEARLAFLLTAANATRRPSWHTGAKDPLSLEWHGRRP
jgi:hypothetical protein